MINLTIFKQKQNSWQAYISKIIFLLSLGSMKKKLYQREKWESSNINFIKCAVDAENVEELITFYGKEQKSAVCV